MRKRDSSRNQRRKRKKFRSKFYEISSQIKNDQHNVIEQEQSIEWSNDSLRSFNLDEQEDLFDDVDTLNQSPQDLQSNSNDLNGLLVLLNNESDDSDNGFRQLQTLSKLNSETLVELLDIFIFNNLTNLVLKKFIKIINSIHENRNEFSLVPKSVYTFKKLFRSEIESEFSFLTNCCKCEILTISF